NVLQAVEKITSDEGLGMSPKRITISTSGVSKMVRKMADDGVKFKLAVSLHSAVEEIRNKIMPFTTNFPLTELRDALQYWYQKTRNKITYEYVVWKGINDDEKSIKALVKFCKHVPCKVNLIEYNAIDDGDFQQADEQAIENYIRALEEAGIVVKVRRSRGKDIDAACGQLANKSGFVMRILPVLFSFFFIINATAQSFVYETSDKQSFKLRSGHHTQFQYMMVNRADFKHNSLFDIDEHTRHFIIPFSGYYETEAFFNFNPDTAS